MGSPYVLEFDLGFTKEAVISLIEAASGVIGRTFVQECSVVRIKRSKGIAELRESKPMVVVFVVSLEE